jgi:hypothetical protein
MTPIAFSLVSTSDFSPPVAGGSYLTTAKVAMTGCDLALYSEIHIGWANAETSAL